MAPEAEKTAEKPTVLTHAGPVEMATSPSGLEVATLGRPAEEDKPAPEGAEEEKEPEKGADEESGAKEEPAEEKSGGAEEDGDDETGAAFSNELLDWAKDAGLTDEDVQSFESEKALEIALKLSDRKLVDEVKGTPAPKAEGEPEAKGGEGKAEYWKAKLDPEVLEEGTVEAVTEIRGALEGMNTVLSGIVEYIQGEGRRANAAAFDKRIADLGEDWKDVFGEGPTAGLTPDSAGWKAREALVDAIAAKEAGYNAAGRRNPGDAALFSRSMREVFGTKFDELNRKQIGKKVRKRDKQIVGRPRTETEPDVEEDGFAKAVKSVNAELAAAMKKART